MSTNVIILLMVAVVAIVVLVVASNSGPRVTQIGRTVERDKDRDDA